MHAGPSQCCLLFVYYPLQIIACKGDVMFRKEDSQLWQSLQTQTYFSNADAESQHSIIVNGYLTLLEANDFYPEHLFLLAPGPAYHVIFKVLVAFIVQWRRYSLLVLVSLSPLYENNTVSWKSCIKGKLWNNTTIWLY